jgi:hypothetical protein
MNQSDSMQVDPIDPVDQVNPRSAQSLETKKWYEISDVVRAKIVVGTFVTALIYEITSKKLKWPQISSLFQIITDAAGNTFVELGNKLFVLCDHITQIINVKDICEAIYKLIYPIFGFVFSPYKICKGLYTSALSSGSLVPSEVLRSSYIIGTGLTTIAVTMTIMEIHANRPYKPSHVINKLLGYTKRFYGYFGRFLSDLSSFYRILGLEHFILALGNVLTSVKEIVVTPVTSTLLGYVENIQKYKYGLHVIGLGTMTLMGMGMYGYYLLKRT